MKRSIARAKFVLRRVGMILRKIDERSKARSALAKHIDKMKLNPSDENIRKLDKILENAFEKERIVAQNGITETKKIETLKNAMELTAKKNFLLQAEIGALKEKLGEYKQLKEHHERKKKAIESKISAVSSGHGISKKITLLEKKYNACAKSGKFTREQLQQVKEKIERLKRLS
jgi:hypothetical protein